MASPVFARGGGVVLNPRPGLAPEILAQKLRQRGLRANPITVPALDRILEREEGKAPEYREAYEDWIRVRAFPYALPDPEAPARARRQRERMPAVPKDLRGRNVIGGNWSFMGPINLPTPYRQYYGDSPITGRVNGAAFHPTNANIFYIATGAGGAWRTVDGGASWQFLSQSWPDLHCSSVAVDPVDPNIVYVGTGDYPGDQRGVNARGFGLMKSTDGGVNWTALGATSLAGRTISDIWIDPTNNQNIVITTGNDIGGSIFRTPDGGLRWVQATSVSANFASIEASAIRSGTPTQYLYASGASGAGGVVLRSSNRGASWSPVTNPTTVMPSQLLIATSKLFADTVYAMASGDNKVFKSTNAGVTWFNTSTDMPASDHYYWSQGNYNFFLATSSKAGQDVIYAGQIDALKSLNGGNSWSSIGGPSYFFFTSRLHNDQHAVAVNPANPDDILVGNDGGIYRYTESTDRLQNLNRLLSLTQFYAADWDNTVANFAIGGAQDNATPWLDNGTWRNVVEGDGGGAVIDPSNRAVMFGSSQSGVYKTDTSWTFKGGIGMGWDSDPKTFVPIMVMDPNNRERVFTASNVLYRIDNWFNGGANRLNGPNARNPIQCIEPARGAPGVVYCGGPGELYMTRDGGNTWANIFTGLPSRTVMDVSSNPTNADDILVTLSGNGTAHVFRCTNVRASTLVWQNVSGSVAAATNLPDTPVNCIERDIDDPQNTWYVGTDIGVFVTLNAGAEWYNATGPLQLPNVPVTAMEAVPATRFLNIATFGRGMWRLPLTSSVAQINSLTTTPTVVYENWNTTTTIRLTRPATYPGVRVALSATGPITVPATVWIPGGAQNFDVRLRTSAVSANTPATITATLNGSSRSASIEVRPSALYTITFTPISAYGAFRITGFIRFLGEPSSSGVIEFTSLSKNVIVPPTMKVPIGAKELQFPLATKAVPNDEEVWVRAVLNQKEIRGSFRIKAPQVTTITPNQPEYKGFSQGLLTFFLTSPAPPGGLPLTVKFSDPNLMKFSQGSNVVVPAGTNQVTMPIVTGNPAQASYVTIRASTSISTVEIKVKVLPAQ